VEVFPLMDRFTHRVENLKSYEIYKVQIALISDSGREGLMSVPAFLKLLEGGNWNTIDFNFHGNIC
jgi:hypothetical protein